MPRLGLQDGDSVSAGPSAKAGEVLGAWRMQARERISQALQGRLYSAALATYDCMDAAAKATREGKAEVVFRGARSGYRVKLRE